MSAGVRRAAFLLAAAALCAPAPALAQEHTPSAEELWKDYPLHQQQQQQQQQPAAEPSRTPRARSSPAAAESNGDDTVTTVVILIAALAAGVAAPVLLRRRPSLSGGPKLRLAGPAVERVTFTPSRPASQPPPVFAARRPNGPTGQGVGPPDTGRSWTAVIEWRPTGEESRFHVVARDEQGSETVIARSEPLDWPPDNPDAVEALVHAADALTEGLLLAGWRALPSGTAWYERRFEFEPATDWAPPVAPRSGRFRPALEGSWQCEIKWHPGYVRSRFEAVAHDPQGGRRVVARSRPFRWLLMADPDPTNPAFRDELRSLVSALEFAGWQPLDSGRAWYSERFVWRGEGEPPKHVEAIPVKAADA